MYVQITEYSSNDIKCLTARRGQAVERKNIFIEER